MICFQIYAEVGYGESNILCDSAVPAHITPVSVLLGAHVVQTFFAKTAFSAAYRAFPGDFVTDFEIARAFSGFYDYRLTIRVLGSSYLYKKAVCSLDNPIPIPIAVSRLLYGLNEGC